MVIKSIVSLYFLVVSSLALAQFDGRTGFRPSGFNSSFGTPSQPRGGGNFPSRSDRARPTIAIPKVNQGKAVPGSDDFIDGPPTPKDLISNGVEKKAQPPLGADEPVKPPTILDMVSKGETDILKVKTPLSKKDPLDQFDPEFLEEEGCDNIPRYNLSQFLKDMTMSPGEETEAVMKGLWTKSKNCYYGDEEATYEFKAEEFEAKLKIEEFVKCGDLPEYSFNDYIQDMDKTDSVAEIIQVQFIWDIIQTCTK